VSIGLLFSRRLCIMDDGDEPVPVLSDVKDQVAIHRIGIFKRAVHFCKIVPPDRLHDSHPRFDFVRPNRVAFHRLAQMPARNDMHSLIILHNM
jgi:hypothetical protein